MKQILRKVLGLLPVLILVIIILLALLAPVAAPYGKAEQDLLSRLQPPGGAHLLGTDELGRDVFSRILYGTRVSLVAAVLPTAAVLLLGTAMGLLCAALGGWADFLIMRLADITLSFPGILLAMVILYTFGGSLSSVFLSLTIMEWGSIARIVRSVTLRIRESEFVLAAKTIGVRPWTVVLRHILPNLQSVLIVLFTLNVPVSILSESSLSFLGIGIQPPDVSLGLMVNQSRQFLFQMPWLSLAPAGTIMLLVLGFNFLGDNLRKVLDPEGETQSI